MSKLEAKIGGIMLAMFTLSGRCARLPAVDAAPDLAPRVLDRDPPLRALEEHDHRDRSTSRIAEEHDDRQRLDRRPAFADQ